VFDNNLLETIYQTKNLFVKWVEVLKNTKQTFVDVLLIKKMFEQFNDHITTIQLSEVNIQEQIKPIENIIEVKPIIDESKVLEIEEIKPTKKQIFVEHSMEETSSIERIKEIPFTIKENVQNNIEKNIIQKEVPIIEVVEQIKPVNNKYFINDKEIDEDLFNIFIKESNNHIIEMKNLLNSESANILTKDFVVHAHTLSSISKEVNLNNFARLVHKIEIFSSFILDKKITLNKIQLKVLKNIVNKLDFYKKTIEGVEIEESLFNEDIALLNELQEDILNEKTKFVEIVNQPKVQEEQVDIRFKQTLEENLNEIKDSNNKVKVEIKNVKETSDSTINIEEMLNTLMNKIKVQIEQQYENFNVLINKNNHDNHEILNELFNKVDNIENNVDKIDKQQKVFEKENKKLFQFIRKDIYDLREIFKKKGLINYILNLFNKN
jgi:hypothetical protein